MEAEQLEYDEAAEEEERRRPAKRAAPSSDGEDVQPFAYGATARGRAAPAATHGEDEEDSEETSEEADRASTEQLIAQMFKVICTLTHPRECYDCGATRRCGCCCTADFSTLLWADCVAGHRCIRANARSRHGGRRRS